MSGADASPTVGPCDLGALELAAALRHGEVDVAEHTARVLELARERGGTVGAFAHLLEELSLEQAATAADALAAARRGGPPAPSLCGIPVPIKDLSRIAGQPWSAGSVVLEGTIAEVTDGPAQRLLDAGTVTIGKTSTPEFGMPCYTEPAIGRPARTPWDLRRTAGGSSGGAAAAVASGIVPLAHGSDGGGSVRIPAACCGILGMKPSRGAVSPGPHAAEGPGLVTDGMLARSVADLAAGLDALVGTRPGDAFPAPWRSVGAAPAGTELRDGCAQAPGPLRIGVLVEPLAIETDVHPAALRGLERAVGVLRALGHEIVPVRRPFTPQQWRAFMPLWTVGAAAIELPPETEGVLMPLTRWLRETGRGYDGADVMRALSQMQLLARSVGEGFDGLDLVLTPALAAPPAFPEEIQLEDPAADFDAQCAFTPWTSTWNMTGRAALAVPLHREQIDGVELPFGVQLGAVRAGDDLLLLQVAAQLEREDPWPLITRPQS